MESVSNRLSDGIVRSAYTSLASDLETGLADKTRTLIVAPTQIRRMNVPRNDGLSPNEITSTFVFDSAWHFHACLAWLDHAKRSAQHISLRYAALELRSGIELLWFETLVMSVGGAVGIKEYSRCSNEATKMYKLIDELSPDYRKLMVFMKLVLGFEKNAPKVAVWDISRLKRYHGESSQFLHFQGIPSDTYEDKLWLGKSIALLEEMANYVWSEMTDGKLTGNMSPSEMEPETRFVWDQFKDEKIDEVGVRTQLRIIWPTLRSRGNVRRSIGKKR